MSESRYSESGTTAARHEMSSTASYAFDTKCPVLALGYAPTGEEMFALHITEYPELEQVLIPPKVLRASCAYYGVPRAFLLSHALPVFRTRQDRTPSYALSDRSVLRRRYAQSGTETGHAATPQNRTQETAFSVQFVPGVWFLILDFAVNQTKKELGLLEKLYSLYTETINTING
eukprot:3846127-Rhodomonas_salina.6